MSYFGTFKPESENYYHILRQRVQTFKFHVK